MKKNILLILISIGIGFYLGFTIFQSYKKEETKPVSLSSKVERFYFVQLGVYSDLNKMKENLSDLKYYIYTNENGLYYVYVGITKDKENTEKLKEYFKKLGYDIYVKELEINNPEFNEVLVQYDTLLKETKDEQAIMEICNQVLNQYEELVIHVESETDTKK